MVELSGARRSDLHSALRAATEAAHRRLERRLALLALPLQRQRFLAILQGFWGFHSVWEPALADCPALASLTQGRSRLALLRADLLALGLQPAEIAALPLCHGAEGLGGSAERLLGSLYVMEGSTLGGQVIARQLQEAAWAPPVGLHYFNPYGARTGAMWRALLAALARLPASEAVIGGARDSFALLHDWLGDRLPA